MNPLQLPNRILLAVLAGSLLLFGSGCTTPTSIAYTDIVPVPEVRKFSIGASFQEVADIMGPPKSMENRGNTVIWYYGNGWSTALMDSVTFYKGRVVEWNNLKGTLNVEWSPQSISQPASLSQTASPGSTYQPYSTPPQARKTAEEIEIDNTVRDILAGPHGKLPPAQLVAPQSGGTIATIYVQNATRHVLTVMYSGNSSRSITIPANEKKLLRLTTGSYRVAARVDAPNVIPFAGTDNLTAATYQNKFYIVTRPR